MTNNIRKIERILIKGKKSGTRISEILNGENVDCVIGIGPVYVKKNIRERFMQKFVVKSCKPFFLHIRGNTQRINKCTKNERKYAQKK